MSCTQCAKRYHELTWVSFAASVGRRSTFLSNVGFRLSSFSSTPCVLHWDSRSSSSYAQYLLLGPSYSRMPSTSSSLMLQPPDHYGDDRIGCAHFASGHSLPHISRPDFIALRSSQRQESTSLDTILTVSLHMAPLLHSPLKLVAFRICSQASPILF